MRKIIEGLTKRCKVCHEELLIEKFTKNRPHLESRKNVCKSCSARRNKEYREKNKKRISLYSRRYRRKNKNELKKYKKNWYYETRAKRLEVRRQYVKNNKEKIRNYSEAYRHLHPIKTKRAARNYKCSHREQINLKNKEWIIKNSERLRTLRRNYYIKNRDKINRKRKLLLKKNAQTISVKRRKYWSKNKEKINQKRREYYRNHREEILKKRSSIDFKILAVLRSRLREVLFIQKAVKLDRTMNLVGCSLKKLKRHLASKFLDGMTWGNYGFYGWHIDHIRPCSSFNLKNIVGQKRCFHYTNLQPLWGPDNLSKNSLYKGNRIRRCYNGHAK